MRYPPTFPEMTIELVQTSFIQKTILHIRGQKVMLDRDLATLYGVTTKRLNEQYKRNLTRFPSDFVFQLTREEKEEVVAKCDRLKSLKFSTTNPNAFTEHRAVMLASILNSDQAIQTSIMVVRAFIQLRKRITKYTELSRKIDELERKYDEKFSVVFSALRQLMEKPTLVRKPIGFKRNQE